MNLSVSKNRIYHPYDLWEDYKAGFYDNCSGSEKSVKIEKVLEMFNSEKLTTIFMNKVIEEWVNSCEHNLTNESMNKIAYIGQGACCLYYNIPSTVTMEAWSLLDKDVRDRSDKIAKTVIEKWNNRNKNKQLCLSLD